MIYFGQSRKIDQLCGIHCTNVSPKKRWNRLHGHWVVLSNLWLTLNSSKIRMWHEPFLSLFFSHRYTHSLIHTSTHISTHTIHRHTLYLTLSHTHTHTYTFTHSLNVSLSHILTHMQYTQIHKCTHMNTYTKNVRMCERESHVLSCLREWMEVRKIERTYNCLSEDLVKLEDGERDKLVANTKRHFVLIWKNIETTSYQVSKTTFFNQ